MGKDIAKKKNKRSSKIMVRMEEKMRRGRTHHQEPVAVMGLFEPQTDALRGKVIGECRKLRVAGKVTLVMINLRGEKATREGWKAERSTSTTKHVPSIRREMKVCSREKKGLASLSGAGGRGAWDRALKAWKRSPAQRRGGESEWRREGE